MNRIRIYIGMIALVSGLVLPVSGQEGKASREDIREQRAYEKQKRKQEKEVLKEQMAVMTKKMVDIQRFVLEADQLSDRYGHRVQVSQTINFILVDSLNGTIQLGSAWSMGYNGVGGQTVDGRITKYEVARIGRMKDNYSIRMNFMSALGTYDITLMVGAEGYADATIRGNWSGQLNYHGRLVPLGVSRIYKGSPSF